MTYAVPIATALSIADDLRVYGYATHGALGISGIDAAAGPTVTAVIAGGPAAHAGVRVGDVIESVDSHAVYSMDDVMAVVRHDRPGQSVDLVLERGATMVRLPRHTDQHAHAVTGRPWPAGRAERPQSCGARSGARAWGRPRPTRQEHTVTTRAEPHELDDVDRELLNAVQWDFPVEARPYAALGERLGISEPEVRDRIDKVKHDGVLRQLSAIFDTRALGYTSALVAAKVDADLVDEAAAIVSAHPGVSHNYKRNHVYNLWYTIAVRPARRSTITSTCCTGRRARPRPANSRR